MRGVMIAALAVVGLAGMGMGAASPCPCDDGKCLTVPVTVGVLPGLDGARRYVDKEKTVTREKAVSKAITQSSAQRDSCERSKRRCKAAVAVKAVGKGAGKALGCHRRHCRRCSRG